MRWSSVSSLFSLDVWKVTFPCLVIQCTIASSVRTPLPPTLPAHFGGSAGLTVLVLVIRDMGQAQILFLPHTSFVAWGKVHNL